MILPEDPGLLPLGSAIRQVFAAVEDASGERVFVTGVPEEAALVGVPRGTWVARDALVVVLDQADPRLVWWVGWGGPAAEVEQVWAAQVVKPGGGAAVAAGAVVPENQRGVGVRAFADPTEFRLMGADGQLERVVSDPRPVTGIPPEEQQRIMAELLASAMP